MPSIREITANGIGKATVSIRFAEPVQGGVDEFGDERLQRGDRARREHLGDQAAQPGVVRRVAVEHGHAVRVQGLGVAGVLQQRVGLQPGGAVLGGVAVVDGVGRAQQRGDVVVPGQDPEAERVLVHGFFGTEPPERRIRVVGVSRREGVEERF
jgi:hypothetical protein